LTKPYARVRDKNMCIRAKKERSDAKSVSTKARPPNRLSGGD
jgi:hypothetical protein